VTAALAAGWVVAAACAVAVVAMRRALERVADAEHELRGAITAFGIGVDRLGRSAAGRPLAGALESELLRARAALAELAGAPCDGAAVAPLERLVRSSVRAWAPVSQRRGIEVEWSAGSSPLVGSPGRVAQAIGNLVSNAVEHGSGPVRVRASRSTDAVRIEVRNGLPRTTLKDSPHDGVVNPSSIALGRRGRGLRIASRAARAAGGRLTVGPARDGVTAALELPVDR
jgi:signal transduction histidine kinase